MGIPPAPPQSKHMRARATSSEKWERPQHMQRSQPTRRTTLGGSQFGSITGARRAPPSFGQRAGSMSSLAIRTSAGSCTARLPGVAPSQR